MASSSSGTVIIIAPVSCVIFVAETEILAETLLLTGLLVIIGVGAALFCIFSYLGSYMRIFRNRRFDLILPLAVLPILPISAGLLAARLSQDEGLANLIFYQVRAHEALIFVWIAAQWITILISIPCAVFGGLALAWYASQVLTGDYRNSSTYNARSINEMRNRTWLLKRTAFATILPALSGAFFGLQLVIP